MGQDHVVLALRNAVRDGRVAHAYLFSGPRGTGKTSTARILAKALNCTDLHEGEPCGVCASCVEIGKGTSLDVHELDAASNNGVEAMRDLVSRAALGTPGRQKVYIVDEVHMLSTAASNALLKTLEEPPAHVVFVLATTDPQKVLPTIRSRTQHFEFRLLGPETLGALLEQVRRDAHLEVTDDALDLAVRRGRGSARDALSVLDQVAASDSVDDDLPELDEVVEALAERDIGRALVAVAHLTSAGFSPQQLTADLVDHLRQGFLSMVAPELMAVSGSEREALAARAERVGLAALVRAMEVLGLAQVDMRDAPDPRVNLEVALVRLAHPEADHSPEALLSRIERLEAAARTVAPAPAAPPAPSAPAGGPPGPGEPPVPPTLGTPPAPPAPEAGRAMTPPSTAGTAPDPASGAGPVGPSAVKPTLGALRRGGAAAGAGTDPSSGERPDAPGASGRSEPPEPTPTPAPTPPEPSAAPAPPTGPFPTRDQLVQAWGDHVIGRLRPKAKALFQAGRFVGVDGERAVFGLPNETHRSRCEEVRGEIEAALADQFGRPIGLELVVDPGAEPPRSRPAAPQEPPRPTPAGTTATGTGSGNGRERQGADRAGSTGPSGPVPPPTAARAPEAHEPHLGDDPDVLDDPADFDESELGELVDVDNSAEARVRLAFPGAEEVG
jgi:DNA polymerase-3 subunit gamma/tau